MRDFDPTGMIALVIDDNDASRALTLAQVRGLGFQRGLGASSLAGAWDLLLQEGPGIVLMEWRIVGAPALDFVRRVRASDEAPDRAVPIFMLTGRGAQADVEASRAAGASGFLRKPLSAATLSRHVGAAVAKPQPFVTTATFVGPCRRRRAVADYSGPWRRLDDVVPAPVAGDEDVLDLKSEIARARVAALEAAVLAFAPGDDQGARNVYKAVQALAEAASQIGDPCLELGAREMARYVQAQGATERLDPEVVRTHVAALHQLASLPHAMATSRENVAQSLKRMIDKKLRVAAA